MIQNTSEEEGGRKKKGDLIVKRSSLKRESKEGVTCRSRQQRGEGNFFQPQRALVKVKIINLL